LGKKFPFKEKIRGISRPFVKCWGKKKLAKGKKIKNPKGPFSQPPRELP